MSYSAHCVEKRKISIGWGGPGFILMCVNCGASGKDLEDFCKSTPEKVNCSEKKQRSVWHQRRRQPDGTYA